MMKPKLYYHFKESIKMINKTKLGNPLIKFFSGYSGWTYDQLIDEINFGTSTGDKISIALAAYNLGVGNINRYLEEIQINLNKENFEITWDDLSSFLTEKVDHNELIGNSTNYKRGHQAVDYVTRVKDYYYLILGLGCN